MEGGVLALGGLTLLAGIRGRAVLRRTPLDAVLAVFYGTLALSTLASGHPLAAPGWLRLWVVLTFFVVAWWVRDRRHAAQLARVVAVAGTVAAAYGIVQHFTGVDWYRGLLGRPRRIAPRAPGAAGFAVVGFFRNYLTFAHVMIFPFAWTTAAALAGRRWGVAAAVLTAVAIVFSTARGAWLAAAATVGALAAIARRRAAAALLAGLALLAAAVLLASPDRRAEVQGMFGLGGMNAPRVAIYRANLDIVHDHPLLGLGFGRYAAAAAPYYDAHPAADRRSHAHSNYLQLAAEAGLTGLRAFGSAGGPRRAPAMPRRGRRRPGRGRPSWALSWAALRSTPSVTTRWPSRSGSPWGSSLASAPTRPSPRCASCTSIRSAAGAAARCRCSRLRARSRRAGTTSASPSIREAGSPPRRQRLGFRRAPCGCGTTWTSPRGSGSGGLPATPTSSTSTPPGRMRSPPSSAARAAAWSRGGWTTCRWAAPTPASSTTARSTS